MAAMSSRFGFLSGLVSAAIGLLVGTATEVIAATGPLTNAEMTVKIETLKTALEGFRTIGEIDKILMDDKSPQANPDVKRMLDETDCKKALVLPDENPPLQAGDIKVPIMSLEVSGAGCPMTYKTYISGTQIDGGFDGKLYLSYKAQSDEARALGDIDEIVYDGTLKASSIKKPQGQGGGVEFDFTFAVTGHSTALGNFTGSSGFDGKMVVNVTPDPGGGMPMIGMDGGMTEKRIVDFFEAPGGGLKGDLRRTMTFVGLAPSVVHTLDGQEITSKQYDSLSALMNPPGIGKLGGPGTSVPPLKCGVEVYRKGDLSLAAAEALLAAGSWPKIAPLKSVSAASDTMSLNNGAFNGYSYNAKFTPDPQFLRVDVEICKGLACDTASRAFLLDEGKAYADAVGDFTVLSRCEMPPAAGPVR